MLQTREDTDGHFSKPFRSGGATIGSSCAYVGICAFSYRVRSMKKKRQWVKVVSMQELLAPVDSRLGRE
jgi:hypothetical protein